MLKAVKEKKRKKKKKLGHSPALTLTSDSSKIENIYSMKGRGTFLSDLLVPHK